jgi:DNA polymerase type B, organellar and viral
MGTAKAVSRADYYRAYNARVGRRASAAERSHAPRKDTRKRAARPQASRVRVRLILAIDGEGYTLPDGSHRYVYMAACSAEGLHSDLRNPKGLKASQVLSWLLSLPKRALLVGFALGYDKTKWLESWPDERVWRVMRPEERQGKSGPLPVDCDGWRVNVVSTRTTVKRKDEPHNGRTVWDVWKFFQSSFVKALDRWQIGKPGQCRFVAQQKDRRGAFRGIGKTEERYCQLECSLLSELTQALLEAHEAAGIGLRSYYGPGSSSAVVLGEMGADRQNALVPERMASAVACAYFGGRFECSRVGPVQPMKGHTKLYAYDIASAYPWAFTRVPCLRPSHGHWVHRKNGKLKGCHPIATCVRFEVRPHKRAHPAWGPLPHRMLDGNILFPLESAGGWAWMPELRAAKKLHPGVTPLESWTWRPTCNCAPPFAERVRELFSLRKSWGKTARGLVLKLLLNSLYGKSAQRAGKGRFRCMVRAGLVTAMTRARLLEAVLNTGSPWAVLELATDSVLSLLPIPGLHAVQKDPALGVWEEKPWEGGAFLLRPGVRFPLLVKSDMGQTAARGIGVKTLHTNRRKVQRAWEREPMAPVTLPTPSFFHGAKLSVRANRAKDAWTRDPLYGRWTSEHRIVNYKPTPKRESVTPDFKLTPWRLPRGPGCESVPYGKAPQSSIGDELDAMRELEEDQPDHAGVAIV